MLLDKSILELAKGLRKKEFSSEDLIDEAYKQIEKIDKKLNSFITVVDKEKALEEARKRDRTLNENSSHLYGLPFVMKDVYVTGGVRTTAGSNALKDYVPQYSSTVYKKLINSGAVLIGKMNLDAWGHGGSSENTDFEPVHNPWDLSRSPGGSSGGPAVAISARMTSFAIGEDTGGSIRNPSAWCGTTGLKVTYGRVSRYGTIAYASSYDTVGPMAKTVEDCALILENIAGKDIYDATTTVAQVDKYSKMLDKKLNLKVGIPKEFFGKGLDGEIKQAILKATKELEHLGVKVQEVSFPMFEYGVAAYYLVGLSETSSNLARYDGVRYGNSRDEFSEETKRRIMIGSYALSSGYYDAYYRQAQKARTLLIEAYKQAFSEVDVLLSPVTPALPAKLGDLMNDPLKSYLADIYTVTQNPAGVPSLALPCGFSKDKLPIGMQIIGPMLSEGLLLNIGHQYQLATDWHKKKPKL